MILLTTIWYFVSLIVTWKHIEIRALIHTNSNCNCNKHKSIETAYVLDLNINKIILNITNIVFSLLLSQHLYLICKLP